MEEGWWAQGSSGMSAMGTFPLEATLPWASSAPSRPCPAGLSRKVVMKEGLPGPHVSHSLQPFLLRSAQRQSLQPAADVEYTSPLHRVNKSLGDFLSFPHPQSFSVGVEPTSSCFFGTLEDTPLQPTSPAPLAS